MASSDQYIHKCHLSVHLHVPPPLIFEINKTKQNFTAGETVLA